MWRAPSDAIILDPFALRWRSATIAWTHDHRRAFVNQRDRPSVPGRASSERLGVSSDPWLLRAESLTFARPPSDRLQSGIGGGGAAKALTPAPRGETARVNAGAFFGEVGLVGRGGTTP